jgi:hypothetical protein
MPNFIKCGQRYINLDYVEAIQDTCYYNTTIVEVLFSGAKSWRTFDISDEDFKDFRASLAKYTN